MRVAALVAPGADLTDADRVRYARHIAVAAVGDEGVRRIRAANVCVVGAGGLGSPVVQYLAGAGVGRLTIIDHDDVEVHNLHRQVIHASASVGEPKAHSAARRVAELNPDVAVTPVTTRLDATTAAGLLAGHDLVVDATDNLPTRYVLNDTCADLDLPLVWGAVSSARAQVSVFWRSHGPDLRSLFPEQPGPEALRTIDEIGCFAPLTGMAGSTMASEVLKLITGAGEVLLGRVLYLDALAGTTAELPLVGRN